MLQMHRLFCEYGDADSLSPQLSSHVSAQSSTIRFARRNLKTNRGICYNHSKVAQKNISCQNRHVGYKSSSASRIAKNMQSDLSYSCPSLRSKKLRPKISLKEVTRILFRPFVTCLSISIYAKWSLSECEAWWADLIFVIASAISLHVFNSKGRRT